MEDFGFLLSKTFATTKKTKREWPYVPGKYFVLDPSAPVAVTTLGSVALAKEISEARPSGLCIVGKVETENIGIEKIIQNVLSNPAIQFLLCVGQEPPKHLTGASLAALFENGVDEKKRIIKSPSMRPVLPNTTHEDIEAFRQRIEAAIMIGCTNVSEICAKVEALAARAKPGQAGPLALEGTLSQNVIPPEEMETIQVRRHDPQRIKLDKAGYFVINAEDRGLVVEHYSYKEELLRVIEGDSARDIYLTIIENGWVTKLDHAAYLGKELARAELSLQMEFDFTQDGA